MRSDFKQKLWRFLCDMPPTENGLRLVKISAFTSGYFAANADDAANELGLQINALAIRHPKDMDALFNDFVDYWERVFAKDMVDAHNAKNTAPQGLKLASGDGIVILNDMFNEPD